MVILCLFQWGSQFFWGTLNPIPKWLVPIFAVELEGSTSSTTLFFTWDQTDLGKDVSTICKFFKIFHGFCAARAVLDPSKCNSKIKQLDLAIPAEIIPSMTQQSSASHWPMAFSQASAQPQGGGSPMDQEPKSSVNGPFFIDFPRFVSHNLPCGKPT